MDRSFDVIVIGGGISGLTTAWELQQRGVRVLLASDAGEQLPRVATTPTHPECLQCAWKDRCWTPA